MRSLNKILLLVISMIVISGCSPFNNANVGAVAINNVPTADFGETVSVNDYFIEVGRGGIGDAVIWNKFGYNEDIDIATSPEVIRVWGGQMYLNLTPQQMSIVSSDNRDNATGEGLEQAIIFGVNGSWNHIIEIIALNGTTPVTTTNTFIGVNRLTVFLSGSHFANYGEINASGVINGNTMAIVPAEKGTTQQCMFFVGQNKRFEAMWLYFNAIKTGGGAQPELDLEFWVYSDVVNSKFEVFRAFLDVSLDTNLNVNPNQIPFNVGERSIIWAEALTDTNNARATCRFSGVLVDD